MDATENNEAGDSAHPSNFPILTPPQVEESAASNFSLCRSFKQMVRSVTLEPMLMMKMMAEGNIKVVADTLKIDLICRVNLNYSREDCLNMDDGNHTSTQNEFNFHLVIIDSLLPMIVILFAGSLSDRYGRKLPMAVVLAGFVALALVYVAAALNPSWPVQVLYGAALVVDMTGTWVVFNMAVYSYVSDITDVGTRTKRMGVMDAVWYMGGPVGTLLGGWLYRHFGYVVVFATSTVLWSICLIYLILVVKESSATVRHDPDQGTSSCNWGPFGPVTSLFRTAWVPYPHNGRVQLLALLVLKLGESFCHGHQVYLWSRRVMGWDATQYSTWNGIDGAVHQIGMLLWVSAASLYNFTDYSVATGGFVSAALWSAILATITGPQMWWIVAVATPAGLIEASIGPAIRTLITSIPHKNDVGKILAFLGLLESIGLVADQSVYTHLYNYLVDTFPQVNFVAQGAVSVTLLLALTVLKCNWNKNRKNKSDIMNQDACAEQ